MIGDGNDVIRSSTRLDFGKLAAVVHPNVPQSESKASKSSFN